MTTKLPFKRSRWEPGMVYAVPLSDGSFGLVQAVAAAMTNVIDVAVFSTMLSTLPTGSPPLHRSKVIALLATWRQDLNRGDWAALGVSALAVSPSEMPNQRLLASGTSVGVKHMTGGVITHLLNAWSGLTPWNVMHDESYFDSKLVPGISRPANAIVLSASDRDAYRAHDSGDA